MIDVARRCHRPPSPLARLASTRRGITRKRSTPGPSTARSAGSKVAAAATETSGIATPPRPMDCMKGSGMKTRSASPMATVSPEKSVARPAVAIVRWSASWGSRPAPSSSRKRKTTSME